MKVIFLQEVPGVGKAGDIKEVANGYAKNFLIPHKLAAQAKSDALNAMTVKIAARARSEARTEAELADLAKQLDGREVFIQAKTGGKERLYGSITTSDIAAEVEKATGFVVDKRKLEVDGSIRQIGSYDVLVKLSKDLVPVIKVTVTEKKAENA
jgi:large subunit ribosomal protein L9